MAPTTRTYGAVALLAASLLAFEVLLTRVCALRLHFHFGFLVISFGLLGLGASVSFCNSPTSMALKPTPRHAK